MGPRLSGPPARAGHPHLRAKRVLAPRPQRLAAGDRGRACMASGQTARGRLRIAWSIFSI
eukprot:scaffold29327_cov101-Isochrysis_galbana.AAC.1